MLKKSEFIARIGAIALFFGAGVLVGGCNTPSLIDHVTFQPSANLESVRVSVVFTNTIQSNLSGAFEVGDYGFLFINPFTPAEPFEVGFQLNTDIVNDQNYVKLTPTEVLPNGLPIGTGVALAQIQGATPVSPYFDLYGYVDVLHTSWLGAAAIFDFINESSIPSGISLSQVFMRDSAGDPGIIASAFGPTVDGSGNMTRAGGIAVFANVRQLMASSSANAQPMTYKPELMPIVSGPRAGEYSGDPAKLEAIQANLVRAFNSRK